MTLNQVENTKEYKERRVNIMIRKSVSFLPILRRRSNAREFSVGKSFFLFFAELNNESIKIVNVIKIDDIS